MQTASKAAAPSKPTAWPWAKASSSATTPAEARAAIEDILVRRAFGDAGSRLVIQELLEGVEVSIHALCDGRSALLFPTAQDHKRALDGDLGLNTGGMGTYSPTPFLSETDMARVQREILDPWLRGCEEEEIDFRGLLYPGLMLTREGPKVLEFNARFGDPETQVYLTRLENDLVELLDACVTGALGRHRLRWSPTASVCVVMASGGYPGPVAKGLPISGLDAAAQLPNTVVFHAGTALSGGRVVTHGGRVLGVTSWAPGLQAARDAAYAAVERIQFEGAQFRRDIAAKALTPRLTPMSFSTRRFLAAALALGCAVHSLQAADASFQEVYDLLKANLAGLDESELNRAAVDGLLTKLRGRAYLATNPAAAGAESSGPVISRSVVYDGTMAYIRFSRIDAAAPAEFDKTLARLSSTNTLKGVVLDLRFADGLDFAAAAALADRFVPAGKPLLDWGKGMQMATDKTNAVRLAAAVLVNRQTTGAAEGLAAALQKNQAALLAGAGTGGSAGILKDFKLKNGRTLRIATAVIKTGQDEPLPAAGSRPTSSSPRPRTKSAVSWTIPGTRPPRAPKPPPRPAPTAPTA